MLSIALCGAGGYGGVYLDALLQGAAAGELALTAVVDPFPERCHRLSELRDRGIPIHTSLDAFYAKGRCDLMILASPIHLHCPQTCLALEHGSHVLCEKPLSSSLEDIDRMVEAERKSGKTVTIGYQWSFSSAIQRLKADWLAGRFGRARRFRTQVCWPREDGYYARNQWAGVQKTAEGEWVLDSPVNNGTSHFLHNMFYVLGPSVAESAVPEKVEAELWRAHPIENYDTASLRILLKDDVEMIFLTSHVTEQERGPLFIYEFDQARVEYDAAIGSIVGCFKSGERIDYGSPEAEPLEKLRQAIRSATTGQPPICGLVAASSHTRCVIMAQAAASIENFPPAQIKSMFKGPNAHRYVIGLDEVMDRCYREGKLFSEIE